jgi:hypothetical protein
MRPVRGADNLTNILCRFYLLLLFRDQMYIFVHRLLVLWMNFVVFTSHRIQVALVSFCCDLEEHIFFLLPVDCIWATISAPSCHLAKFEAEWFTCLFESYFLKNKLTGIT